VNRLTRELSLLRAQTASVASTASSASTNIEPNDGHNASARPRAGSRHRSSSTLSSRSLTGGSTYVPGSTIAALTSTVPSRDSGAPSSRQSVDLQRPSLSRELSALSPLQPDMSSPPSFHNHEDSSHRSSLSQPPSGRDHRRSESASSTSGTLRYEEAARHRAELEVVKRENESLRRRVRELEKILREHRHT
ncbi:hypothetical protein FQN49_006777, partial [Arthroderma sp. PD_2]